MELKVREGSTTKTIQASEGMTVLEALQRDGAHVDAPCGGAGTCKKCMMLISDAQGISYRLACQTKVTQGCEVTLEKSSEMSISLGGVFGPWPADGEAGSYGLAFDIGTTTVVARLHDMGTGELIGALGAPNPQLAFGADVLSRISCCPDGGLEKMQALIGEKLVSLASQLMRKYGVGANQTCRAVVTGNTTMLHIAAGLDPTSIGVSPFTPQSLFGEEIVYEPFVQAGIAQGRALFAPCVAGYVGGDISCGISACGIDAADACVLMLDLGTNGEMALGSKDGIISCATAAGPVFEGANIKYGMPAYAGAISKVALGADGDLELSVIGGEEPVGICGTALFDIVALLLAQGIVDETGRMVDDDELEDDVPAALVEHLCEEDDAPAFRVWDHIVLTQKDVRCLQLAKASVCAGVETMMEEMDVAAGDISDFVIAGGFGEYLNLDSAAKAGLFPAELRPLARSVGNSAIEGASQVLLSAAGRAELAHAMELTRYIELSGHATFNDLYIDDMMFE